jgi:outer membrane protein assembly factor BamB
MTQLHHSRLLTLALAALAACFPLSPVLADDWPEWRGTGREGVWEEDGILTAFPEGGLTYTWRVPVAAGYSGPAVAGGRVFVTDFRRGEGVRGTERVLCLDEATGKVLWTHEWPVEYRGLDSNYAIGPRATPTVDGDRVYVLGTMGALLALDVRTGEILWEKDFVEDFGTQVPPWGMTGAPLVEGNLLISLVGGEKDAKVVAFHKRTGAEVWRALPSDGEPGYNPPFLAEVGGVRQVIIWHPEAVAALAPDSGKLLWEVPFKSQMGMTVATPVLHRDHLLVSAFFDGSMLLKLEGRTARKMWEGTSESEIDTEGLHALIGTPLLDAGQIYGICSYGQLRALDLETGRRLWESQEVTVEKARWAAAFFVRNGDRVFINNDRGDLIIARLTEKGYREIDRTFLIEPTSPARRREKGAVHWSHPAYANRHIVVRNDREIVRASLEGR